MPPEPKKKIEELLEASAQKRRAEFGRDPAMPNPMRVRLHEEIAEITGNREPVLNARPFGLRWPQLILGAAFACLVVGGGSLLWLTQRQTPNETARFAAADRLESVAPPPAAPSELQKRDQLADAAASSVETKTALAKAEPAAPAVSQTFSPAAAAGAIAEKSVTIAAAGLTQQFSQVATNEAVANRSARAPSRQVLANFQVEQIGRDIRVVDEDGSTYRGRIEELSPNDTRNVLKLKQPATMTAEAAKEAPAERDGSTANNEFYFRASGYNHRLQKPLVFEGNYIVDAPAGRKDLQAEGQKKNGLAPARILGTAKIGGQPPVPIDAVTVPAK